MISLKLPVKSEPRHFKMSCLSPYQYHHFNVQQLFLQKNINGILESHWMSWTHLLLSRYIMAWTKKCCLSLAGCKPRISPEIYGQFLLPNVVSYTSFTLIQLNGFDLEITIWTKTQEVHCQVLTHWGQVTYICVGKLFIIDSDNGLSPERRQAIISTNAGILLIGPSETNFSEILIRIQAFSYKKMHLKI